MLNVWDNWDQSFYDIPKIYYILVLFPYKEITKFLNSIFSKTTQRNFNIFSGWFFKSILSIYVKKEGVKRWTQNFQFNWQFLVCYTFKKLWGVVPIKFLFLRPGKFALFQKNYSLDTLGERGHTVHSVAIWA